jgi:flagellar protein FliJ
VIRPFRFKLQPVLELRERREDLLKRELGQALVALSSQQERAVRAEQALERSLDHLRDEANVATTVHDLRQRHSEIERLRRVLGVERATARQLEEVAIDRRADLVRASQEREALVTLRRHAHTEHRREESRHDQIAMDELAQRRALHGSRGNSPSGAAA